MKFCFDKENEGFIWVDREIDEQADHFEPCDACHDLLKEQALEDRVWQELDLCDPCADKLDLRLAINDFLELPRPFIGDHDLIIENLDDDHDLIGG